MGRYLPLSVADAGRRTPLTTDCGAPSFATLFAMLEARAALTPDKVVFRFLGSSLEEEAALTYGVLVERARKMADALVADGLADQRIVLGHETGPEFAVAFFAVMAAGGTAIPLATRHLMRPSAALDSLLATAQPAAILMNAEVVARRPLTHLKGLWTGRARTDAGADRLRSGPNPIAVIQFTSGSTSDPKGVCISHANFIANAAAICRAHDHTADDVAVSWLPLFHDMGLMLGMVWPVCIGASTVLMRPSTFVSRPVAWLQAISRYGASVSSSPNFGYQACLDRITDAELSGIDLTSWRIAISGAEPIRPATVEGFIARFAPLGFDSRALVPAFGLAEATVFVSGGLSRDRPRILDLDDGILQREGRASPVVSGSASGAPLEKGADVPRRFVSCGRPADNVEIAIVDVDGTQVLPEGGVGEIWVAGPSIAGGYFNAETATRETFHATSPQLGGSFLRTGDLGFLFDGELYVAGRLKDLIIVRGANHYPQDIEATVRAADPGLAMAECAAFVDEDDRIVVVAEVPADLGDFALLATAIRHAVAGAHPCS